jgi:hypothetical protein
LLRKALIRAGKTSHTGETLYDIFLAQIYRRRRHPCRLKFLHFFIKGIVHIKHLWYIFYGKFVVYKLRIIIMEEKMKTKHFFNAVMVVIIAVIFSAMAGCASTGAMGDPATAELAEQFAADINAIEAGKATVSGDTVTLTGGVRIENAALTVPAGVTLDLTKETLQLGDGAALTVDGTVNTKAEGINIDSATASPATINGSGTISLKSKGRLLGIWEGKKLTLDGVTLAGLSDNDKPIVEMGNGGELVMESGKITGNTINSKGAGGAGVGVWEGGTFTMKGGTISGNTANGSMGAEGGGVVVAGTFTMEGGEISGNTAKGDQFASGGGVYVGSESVSVFTMKGGTISGNSAISTNNCRGGGVCVNSEDATFIMEGGTIYGSSAESGNANTATEDDAALYVWGAAKWGTGGTYTQGGVSQTGGGDIGATSDTLIAVPGK